MSDGRAGGFIVLHRRIKSWPVYQAMNAEQRHVVTEMLLAARWQSEPGEFWFGPLKFEVPRGGYFMSEDVLAKDAGTTRKVVRTVYAKLLTEGFITRKAVHSSGQCPHLVTIVNYDKYQSLSDEAGQWQGQRRAQGGPETGQRRAPNEPQEPVEPQEPLSLQPPPAAAVRAEPKDPRKAEKRAAFERAFLEIRGEPYYWQGAKDWTAVQRLIAVPLDEWERRARLGLTTTDYSRRISTVALLGMKWNDLAGAGAPASGASKPVTAPASPPAAFTKGGRVAL